MKGTRLLAALLAVSYGHASESVFSVQDDVLAFPQFEIVFPKGYISEANADKTRRRTEADLEQPQAQDSSSELSSFRVQDSALPDDSGPAETATSGSSLERMILGNRPYLCTIPHVEPPVQNETKDNLTEADHEKELVQAADRGWELLQDMEGKCLFFSTGWWSYSFCYNSQIKQFHSLPPGANGAPMYPPAEDPTTPSYILGKFESKRDAEKESTKPDDSGKPITELQTRAQTSYLVQKLGGGTACDLTGKERKVEIQFHCHPQSTDRIAWIKETATCTYLMIIHTPRLCNDVAFLPPREVKANPIVCQEILKPADVADWEARKSAEATRKMIDQGPISPRLVVGDIEVGGMKEVGREGRRIEKGKVVYTPEERAETVAAQKNGKLEGWSKADLRKRNINPEAVEAFRKELQKRAGDKDWQIQVWDEANGQLELRGIIAAEPESEDEPGERDDDDPGEGDMHEGSEEVYKEDI